MHAVRAHIGNQSDRAAGVPAVLARVSGGAPPRLEMGPVHALDAATLRSRLSGAPLAGVFVTRTDDRALFVHAEVALCAHLTGLLFGVGDRELFAPRAATFAEKGVLAYLVAATLDAWGAQELFVEGHGGGVDAVIERLGAGPLVTFEVYCYVGEVRGRVRVVCANAFVTSVPRRRVFPLSVDDAHRLGGMGVPVMALSGRARLRAAEMLELAAGDVVVLDAVGSDREGNGAVALRVGTGSFSGHLAQGTVTLTSGYQLGEVMDRQPDEELADGVSIDLVCCVGRSRISLRDLLALGAGSVVSLGTRAGSPVELVDTGGKIVARGELVDVDGELGVRITDRAGD